ncbi:MAG: dimethyl sulfoxide reductase anchor subunit [Alphaproteobacteria bacterium]|jgi:DMSO reductase anchor subunit|nr:dimethyl sulfoxide reductase anchor subunit [Alphaproteobacteria bacterium]
MHPAFSVIIFTTASGAGYGLLALTGFFAANGWLPADSAIIACAIGLALVLITGGLLCSTAHLGHPGRAWRAISQWRSSWLSREGLFALVTYIPAVLFFLGIVAPDMIGVNWKLCGLIAGVMSLITIYSTGKIYASLETIRQWRDGRVVPLYILIGLLGGSILIGFLAAVFGVFIQEFAWIILALAVVTGMLKMTYWRSIEDEPARSTSNTATGLGGPGEKVRLLDAPNTSENFVMREMGFRIARKHSTKLRQITLTTLFAIPLLLTLLASMVDGQALLIVLTLATVVSAGIGSVVERWLFFAEARHVVTLYYGAEAA